MNIGAMNGQPVPRHPCRGFGNIVRGKWPWTGRNRTLPWGASAPFSPGFPRLALFAWPKVTARKVALAALLVAMLVTTAAGELYGQTARNSGRVSPGGGRLVLTERGVWDYAETLFRGGEFYRAISEYKRLLHYFPDSSLERAARMRIGEAYLQGGEAGLGIAHLGVLLTLPRMAPFRPELLYLRGIGRLELKRHLPYAQRADHVRAGLNDLSAIPAGWPGRKRVAAFVRAMEAPARPLPSKSPWLAGGLSALLPGAGSAYGGGGPREPWPSSSTPFSSAPRSRPLVKTTTIWPSCSASGRWPFMRGISTPRSTGHTNSTTASTPPTSNNNASGSVWC